MPPSFTKIKVNQIYDGLSYLDLREKGLNFIYIPDFLDQDLARNYFKLLTEKSNCLDLHKYIGQFNKTIEPKRYTYAKVPGDHDLKFKGKPVYRKQDEIFDSIFNELISCLPETFLDLPDASIVNGYRYNGIDYIRAHLDNEKFLLNNNTTYWKDSSVATISLLRDTDKPMIFYAGDPITGEGFGVQARNGSLIIHGNVLHEIRPLLELSYNPNTIGRISITLRKIKQTCHHSNPEYCSKPNCSRNLGPSNYLYYSNSSCLHSSPGIS